MWAKDKTPTLRCEEIHFHAHVICNCSRVAVDEVVVIDSSSASILPSLIGVTAASLILASCMQA
jgi:hypothetical protein